MVDFRLVAGHSYDRRRTQPLLPISRIRFEEFKQQSSRARNGVEIDLTVRWEEYHPTAKEADKTVLLQMARAVSRRRACQAGLRGSAED